MRVPAGFDLAMNFMRRLGNEEKPAANQDDVAPGDAAVEDRDDRLGQADQPRQSRPHDDAKHEGEREPDRPRLLRARGVKPRREYGDEDQIVDAENDFE